MATISKLSIQTRFNTGAVDKQWSNDNPHIKDYKSRRWQAVRKNHFISHPFCVICKAQNIDKMAQILDHIKPVSQGGDFWDSSNHQGLCKSHHNSKSNSERGK